MSTVLEVQNLSKHFSGLKAVENVSFTLKKGDMTALIGPNGAGKTTCFNMLSGALDASAGTIHFKDTDITKWPAHRRATAGIGRTFQIAQTFRSMTVLENIETALMAADHPLTRARGLLDELSIADKAQQAVTALAYGDVKRVELAMALATKPQLLLLDEPTAGMAAAERRHIMQTIAELVTAHAITVLFTEHDMDAVFGFASRILAMSQGRLIADGNPDDVRSDAEVQRVYFGDVEAGDA